MMRSIIVILAASCAFGFNKGSIKSNFLPSISISVNGVVRNLKATLDANWRWIHTQQGQDCYQGTSWNTQYCPNSQSCIQNCFVAGVEQSEYENTYGVRSIENGKGVSIQFVTKHQYGTTVGSRLYLLDEQGQNYFPINPLGKEVSFMLDNSQIPCGVNHAVYFTQIPLDGSSSAGAAYGTGYGDAQCPRDIKLINGVVNTQGEIGACASEFDLAESNSRGWQGATVHPCKHEFGVQTCFGASGCGEGTSRYTAECDKDGQGWNPYQLGNKTTYGKGVAYTINTEKPFRVRTQFWTDSAGNLDKIVQILEQDGKSATFSLTDDIVQNIKQNTGDPNYFKSIGGMKKQGFGLKNNVLVMSLWDDMSPSQMKWLDGVLSSTDIRGPCVTEPRDPSTLRQMYPDIQSKIYNIEINDLVTTTPTPAPTPSPIPTPLPSPTPSPAVVDVPDDSNHSCLEEYLKCLLCAN